MFKLFIGNLARNIYIYIWKKNSPLHERIYVHIRDVVLRMVEAIWETLFPLLPLPLRNEIPVRECYTIVTLAIVNGMGNIFCRRVIPRVSIVWTHGLGKSAMC